MAPAFPRRRSSRSALVLLAAVVLGATAFGRPATGEDASPPAITVDTTAAPTVTAAPEEPGGNAGGGDKDKGKGNGNGNGNAATATGTATAADRRAALLRSRSFSID